MDEFKAVCGLEKADIVAVTETWFIGESITTMAGFNVYKKNRACRRGGGVAIYIVDHLTSFEVEDVVFKTISKLEQVWTVVVVNGDKYLVGCVYRPSDWRDMNDLRLVFETAREYVGKHNFKELIIFGDFNLSGIS